MHYTLMKRKTLITGITIVKGSVSDLYKFDFSDTGTVPFSEWANAIARFSIRETSVRGKAIFENVPLERDGDSLSTFAFRLTANQTAQLPLGMLVLSVDYGLPSNINYEGVEALLTVIEPLPNDSQDPED